jgi:hypothetical protein
MIVSACPVVPLALAVASVAGFFELLVDLLVPRVPVHLRLSRTLPPSPFPCIALFHRQLIMLPLHVRIRLV